ncbi:VOC family protein [Streptomyces sp. NPDC004111]|uniref:VOC family protein n=1 Tax=Streptomyces sp. NPDC004111 TaxID=3364690 RepID=UPI0036CA6666
MPSPVSWKLVVDCADPHAQAAFWAQALDYVTEDHGPLCEQLLSSGTITEDLLLTAPDGRRVWRHAAAVRHPEDPVQKFTDVGLGRRLLFQLVPEAKQGKNRLHIDLHFGPERRDAEVARLEGLGAKVLNRVSEPGSTHVTLADPEGNEFCVQ